MKTENKKVNEVVGYVMYPQLYVYDVEYGIEDYIKYSYCYESKIRRSKIRYTNNPYFMCNGKRIRISNIIRI